MKPAFIGIGAQKCASTWLHRILTSHPQVALPDLKEINFFSYQFDHGYQWYERQFDGCTGARCTGEVSPSYFYDPCAPERLRRYHGEIRILLTLRDPVERAISNHKHEVRLGHLVGDLSFEAGLANNPMYVEQGLYGKHLSSWMTCFPQRQIYVALMEDIRDEPARVAREVFRFLGIDDAFVPPMLETRFNPSYANRSLGLVRLKDQVYRLSQAPGMGWLWSAATGIGARDLYRRLNITDSSSLIPPLRHRTLEELRCVFADDVRRLEGLLGRDLSHWLGANHKEQVGGLLTREARP
jgi:hypothetical protein